MNKLSKICAWGLLLLAGSGGTAAAAALTDPQGDFIPSYIGPKNGDLDVLAFQGVYNGSTIRLDATLNGAPGATSGGLYVWGLQRGQGTARFGAIAPGVVFDAVVSITPGGVTSVRDLVSGAAVTLPASATVITGNKISVTFDASVLPSLGLSTPRYLINLWPRNGGANANISDFAPDNSDAPLTLAFPTPEAASAQTDLAIDESSVAFDNIARHMRGLRSADGSRRVGGFLTAYGRTGPRGLAGSFVGRHDSWSLMGGLDAPLGSGFVIGVAGRGGRTTATLIEGSHLTADTLGGTLYATWTSGPLFVSALVDAARQDLKSSRALLIGANALTARSTPKSDTLSGGGQVGFVFGNGHYAVIPAADLIVTRARVNAYDEAEPLGFGASVDSRSRQSTRLGLGVALEQTEAPAWGSLFLHGSARYVKELGDRSDNLTYAFSAQPENHFGLPGAKTGADYGVLDVGFDANFAYGSKLSLDYAPRFDSRGLMDHQLSATARFSF